MRRALCLAAVALLLAGCGETKPKQKGIGEQTAEITEDTRTLEDATGAANSILRNSSDCEVVKAALPDANRRMDEAAAKLKTNTGRVTLDALRTQVRTVAQNCP